MIRRIITVKSMHPLLKSTVRSVHFSLTRFPPKNSNEERLKPPVQGDPVRRINCYDALLTECIDRRALDEGRGVHGHMIKAGFVPRVYLQTRLILFYVRCDFFMEARKLFEGMRDRNIATWTTMISGCSRTGHDREARDLFMRMLGTGIHPNEFTFATVLTACVAPFGFDHGRQIHTQVVKNGFNTHKFVGSSLLDMYAKAGRIHEARKIFNSLPEQDVVSCTAIIAGYAQLGLDKEALEMFQKLFNQGLKSNSVTYASILTAITGLSNLDYGRQVHGLVIRCELPYYVALQNSLIDMYSKCGALTCSRRVFDNMLQKNVISWNAMLVGYGKHGCGEDVIELFKEMLKSEISPNRVTYVAVLSGCSHGGLVKEGLGVFEMLIRDREVKPDIEHYGCVVDLLGRAGQVEKAFEFVKQMPFKPTAAIWGSLLNACRVHSNVPIGEFVARKLFEIEPENAGNYVNVSNIYATSKRWEDMCYVRELMKEKAVVKEPGQSWTKMDLLE